MSYTIERLCYCIFYPKLVNLVQALDYKDYEVMDSLAKTEQNEQHRNSRVKRKAAVTETTTSKMIRNSKGI